MGSRGKANSTQHLCQTEFSQASNNGLVPPQTDELIPLPSYLDFPEPDTGEMPQPTLLDQQAVRLPITEEP